MIYFIQEAGDQSAPIKIGFTASDPTKRLGELQTGYPAKLTVLHARDGSIIDEKEEHDRWGHLRIHGEWFRAEPELVEYVRSQRIGLTDGKHRPEKEAFELVETHYAGCKPFRTTGLRKQCPRCWKMGWVFIGDMGIHDIDPEGKHRYQAFVVWDGMPPDTSAKYGGLSTDIVEPARVFSPSFGCGHDIAKGSRNAA